MNGIRRTSLPQRLAAMVVLGLLPLVVVAFTGGSVKGITLVIALTCGALMALIAVLTAISEPPDSTSLLGALNLTLNGGAPGPGLPAAEASALECLRARLNDRPTVDASDAADAARIRVALDKVASSVMVCDANGNIVYMNERVTELFQRNASEIRTQLPGFDPDRIVGSNFDVFHRNPSHPRNVLSALRGTHAASMTLGAVSIKILATPITDANGARLGYVVQWIDRTQELATEAEVNRAVAAAAEGDLTNRIPLEGKTGFFATLASGINSLLDNMANTIASIKGSATEVSRGADEISRGNINLSQRTEQQAASLEETASSMEQMTSTVKQNADNAAQANSLASAARVEAERGGAVVAEAVVAMQSINEASNEITDIIGVIDTIAFQTNLLALNAAVEAARAGEQGRGFAVVASEVRNLASRSSEAAKEIKRLIHDSVERVEAGTNLVDRSGQALGKIVASVQQVSQIVSEIAAASREQSIGIEQVNKAVASMDEVTQQNAALVEQAAAAAQALTEEARSLDTLMSKYRVGGAQVSGAQDGAAQARASAPVTRAPAVERRSANRPFRGKAGAGAQATAHAKKTEEWDEF